MRRAISLAVAVALAAHSVARADVAAQFPDNTAYVVRLNVNSVFAQPTVLGDAKSIKAALGDTAKIMESCGIDPTRDIARATLAVGAEVSARTAVLFVEGTFDPAKVKTRLTALITEKKSEVEARTNGVFRWTLPPDKAQPTFTLPRHYYVAVLDAQTAVLGIDEGAVNDAIDKKAGRKRIEPPKAVIDLLRKTDPRQAVNFVAVPPASLVGTSRASGLTHITGGLTANDALKFEATCAMKDETSAKALAGDIDNAAADIKQITLLVAAQSKSVSPQQLAMLREFFSTFKVAATANSVALSSVLSREFLEKNSKK